MAGRSVAVRRDILPWMQVGLALAGVMVAGYLTWSKLRGEGLLCIGFRGCDIVNNSPYAELLGLPVAAWGLGAYLVLFLLGFPVWESRHAVRPWVVSLSFTLALGGWLFSMYLTAIEAFVLRAWCSWCVTSAILITLLLGVCGARFYRVFYGS